MKWICLSFLCIETLSFAKDLPIRALRVSDGDTLRVELNGIEERVRLICIDAPEKDQPFGLEAKQILTDLVMRQDLVFEFVEKDPYGRLLGFIKRQGEILNQSMVEQGYAWNYDHYCGQRYQAQEDKARKARQGLWVDPNPINPYDWRQTHLTSGEEE